jgi:hypothetical protein
MLLKTSFEAERDEGSDCASLPLSVSNSAKIESSITVESTSGTRITVLMSRTILSTRTTSVKGSNSGASNCNVYSPGSTFSITNPPRPSVVAVISPGVTETFTPSTATRPSRETTLPLIPPL